MKPEAVENKLFLVKKIRNNLKIEVLGLKQEVKLSWCKGMEGAVPVFENKEDALEYADGDEELIIEMFYK